MGDSDDGASGPFHNAYNTFCKGGVISLVVGSHGETNLDFQDFLKVCAHMAVARGDAVCNSPIFEFEVKGAHSSVTLTITIQRLPAPSPVVSPRTNDQDYILFGAQEKRQVGFPRMQGVMSHETGRCAGSDRFLARHSIREHSNN